MEFMELLIAFVDFMKALSFNEYFKSDGFFKLALIIVFLLQFLFDARRNRITEHRAKLRAEEATITMALMSSSIKLAIELAHAVKCDSNNNVKNALNSAEKAQHLYDEFMQDKAAKYLNKI